MNKHLYFIGIAKSVAPMSKDPSTKVGCLIVDKDKRTVSTGYNGFVQGCDESLLTWERPMKYQFVIHAEMNAVSYSGKEHLQDHVMYVTHAPCIECLKNTLQWRIREIWYDSAHLAQGFSEDSRKAIITLIKACGAKVTNANTGMSYEQEILNLD